jgi:hypothetical protein
VSGLPMLVSGLQRLIENERLRAELGQEGRRWVERTHYGGAFLRAFDALCKRAGVDRESLAPTHG